MKRDLFKNVFINKNIPIPAYYQIQNIIRNMIIDGKLKENDKLPVETELCEIFGVSRMTIKQALDNLVASGELIRQKGKGTFVKSSRITFELSRLFSFSEEMNRRGFIIGNIVIESDVIDNNKKLMQKLKTKDKIFKLTRVRYVNNQPYALETSFIPLMRCPGIFNEEDLSAISLFEIFEKKYNLKIDSAEQIILPVVADKKLASIMKISINTPLLKMEGITYIKNKIPIEYIIGYYRGDRYKFILKLKR